MRSSKLCNFFPMFSEAQASGCKSQSLPVDLEKFIAKDNAAFQTEIDDWDRRMQDIVTDATGAPSLFLQLSNML